MRLDYEEKKTLWRIATYVLCAIIAWCIGVQTMASCHLSGDIKITPQLVHTLDTIIVILSLASLVLIILMPKTEHTKAVHRAKRATRRQTHKQPHTIATKRTPRPLALAKSQPRNARKR